ncbi:hypothetical protein ACH5RR_023728 [Cinchona calisaya]|uniref:SWIM-type domain-containing protein n=1 Tax=Cinchona calisaya TaxID=153742 RepID=A0ABD2ZBH7_9GENT
MILRQSLGTVVRAMVEMLLLPYSAAQFQRMFVMFDAQKKVMEIENKDSWMWFIELLLECIGRLEEMGWIFISDGQKDSENIEEIKIAATCCEVSLAEEAVYEVVQGQKKFIVDARRSCTCKNFDMTGIPCLHGAAATMSSNHQVEEFVHEYYWKSTYLKAYEHLIVPIPDKSQWIQTDYDPIMAPQMRRGPGRPKKARSKAIDEPKNKTAVRRHFQQIRCSKCGNYGHNIRTCKAPRQQKETAENFKSLQLHNLLIFAH